MNEELAEIRNDLREIKRAVFGDMFRQELGMEKLVDQMSRQLDQISRDRADVARLVPMVEELMRSDEERRRERAVEMSNRVSRAALDVMRTLSVMLLAWPVMAWDWREMWGGRGLLAPVGVMLGLIALFAVVSILTRK